MDAPLLLAYDVLEIRGRDGKWLSFSTLRTTEDMDIAIRLVDTDGAFSGFRPGPYRIVGRRNCTTVTLYPNPSTINPTSPRT